MSKSQWHIDAIRNARGIDFANPFALPFAKKSVLDYSQVPFAEILLMNENFLSKNFEFEGKEQLERHLAGNILNLKRQIGFFLQEEPPIPRLPNEDDEAFARRNAEVKGKKISDSIFLTMSDLVGDFTPEERQDIQAWEANLNRKLTEAVLANTTDIIYSLAEKLYTACFYSMYNFDVNAEQAIPKAKKDRLDEFQKIISVGDLQACVGGSIASYEDIINQYTASPIWNEIRKKMEIDFKGLCLQGNAAHLSSWLDFVFSGKQGQDPTFFVASQNLSMQDVFSIIETLSLKSGNYLIDFLAQYSFDMIKRAQEESGFPQEDEKDIEFFANFEDKKKKCRIDLVKNIDLSDVQAIIYQKLSAERDLPILKEYFRDKYFHKASSKSDVTKHRLENKFTQQILLSIICLNCYAAKNLNAPLWLRNNILQLLEIRFDEISASLQFQEAIEIELTARLSEVAKEISQDLNIPFPLIKLLDQRSRQDQHAQPIVKFVRCYDNDFSPPQYLVQSMIASGENYTRTYLFYYSVASGLQSLGFPAHEYILDGIAFHPERQRFYELVGQNYSKDYLASPQFFISVFINGGHSLFNHMQRDFWANFENIQQVPHLTLNNFAFFVNCIENSSFSEREKYYLFQSLMAKPVNIEQNVISLIVFLFFEAGGDQRSKFAQDFSQAIGGKYFCWFLSGHSYNQVLQVFGAEVNQIFTENIKAAVNYFFEAPEVPFLSFPKIKYIFNLAQDLPDINEKFIDLLKKNCFGFADVSFPLLSAPLKINNPQLRRDIVKWVFENFDNKSVFAILFTDQRELNSNYNSFLQYIKDDLDVLDSEVILLLDNLYMNADSGNKLLMAEVNLILAEKFEAQNLHSHQIVMAYRAAEDGNDEAAAMLADIFFLGSYGVEKNYQESLKFRIFAAENGNNSEYSIDLAEIFCLGIAAQEGFVGLDIDYKNALIYAKKAAAHCGEDDYNTKLRIQYVLAKCHINELVKSGQQINFSEAFKKEFDSLLKKVELTEEQKSKYNEISAIINQRPSQETAAPEGGQVKKARRDDYLEK